MPTNNGLAPTWLMTGAAIAILGLAGCNKNNESTEAPAATAAESAASPASANAAIPASGPAAAFMPIETDMKQKMAAAVGSTVESTWAMKMMAHHQGGIDMSRALLNQSPNGPMHDMAQKTMDMQTKDRAELDKWVQAHAGEQGGQANPFAEMEATMSQKMMAATGADADQTWARKMIEHHQGSIDMSKRVLQDAKDPEIRRMAQKTIDMQTKEIAELQSKLGG